jgi:hypothetical protein
MGIVTGVLLFVRAMFAIRATIAAENLALRHQLGVLQRPGLNPADGIFRRHRQMRFPSGTTQTGLTLRPLSETITSITPDCYFNRGNREIGDNHMLAAHWRDDVHRAGRVAAPAVGRPRG